METDRFVTEIFQELKNANKRMFIMLCVSLALELITILAFLWYISLPVEDVYSIEQDADNSSSNQIIGGDYNGGETEDN